jgi:hypothetical protein
VTCVPAISGDARRAAPTVTVALLGPGVPAADTLRAALLTLPTSLDVVWSVGPDDPGDDLMIVLCDAELTGPAVRRWPAAAAVALVGDRDDGAAVVRALEEGADICIRGRETGLIAAYVQSVARRRTVPSRALAG